MNRHERRAAAKVAAKAAKARPLPATPVGPPAILTSPKPQQRQSSAQRIVLAIIVKNEAHVIRRCLDSVRPFIHYGVICDTGSTDGTQDVIRAWSADNGVPVEVHEREWIDFATNRTQAFELARSHGDYALVIDADEELEAEPDFVMPRLTTDENLIAVYSHEDENAVDGWRSQLLRTAVGWRYRHRIHEFPAAEQQTTRAYVRGIRTVTHDDGARSRDALTQQRDIELLEREHAEHPDDARWAMYLSHAYIVVGQSSPDRKVAQALYGRAIGAGKSCLGLSPSEFGYWALLNVAAAHALRCDTRLSVIGAYLSAFNMAPFRAEALRYLAGWCRSWSDNALADLFDDAADQRPLPHPSQTQRVWPKAYEKGARLKFRTLTSDEAAKLARGWRTANEPQMQAAE